MTAIFFRLQCVEVELAPCEENIPTQYPCLFPCHLTVQIQDVVCQDDKLSDKQNMNGAMPVWTPQWGNLEIITALDQYTFTHSIHK